MFRFYSIIFSMSVAAGNNVTKLAADYFSFKAASYVVHLNCDVYESKLVSSRIMGKDLRFSTYSTSDIDYVNLDVVLIQRFTPVGVLLDTACNSSTNILTMASKLKLFDAMHMWLLLDHDHVAAISKESYVFDTFSKLNLSVDADIALVNANDDHYVLLDIFNYGKIQGNPLEINNLGTWSEEKGLNICIKGFKYYHRWNFHNLTLRAISVILHKDNLIFTPDILSDVEYSKYVSAMTKISSIVLNLFKEQHNFRFNYTIADRWVGWPIKNASLAVTNAMAWELQDISSTSLRIQTKWLDWMDPFFPPVTYLETKFYYRIPNTGVGDYENRFIQPLSASVWWCTLLAFGVCGVILAFASLLEKRPSPAIYAFFSVIATLFQQDFEDGMPMPDDSLSSQGRKMVLFVIGMSSMLLYNYYTSSVVSWLLNAAPPTIDNLDGLIHSNLELVFEDIGYTRSWLESPGFFYYRGYTWPKEDELRDKKVTGGKRTVPLLQTVEEGIELMKRGGVAYHSEPYNANMRISRTFDKEMLCELGSLQMMRRAPVYIVGQRRSPYRQFFVWSILRALERGHLSCARRRVDRKVLECDGGVPRALSLGQAAPAFALLVYGCLLSLSLLFIEIMWHSKYG